MSITKAVNRIFWRFGGNGNTNPFPINEADVKALEDINEYVERTQKEQYQANELFAKIFILAYAKMIEHYKTDVFDDAPRKAMYKLLDRPLTDILQEVTERFNDVEKYNLIESIQGHLKHPATLSEAERLKSTTKTKKALRNEEIKKRILENPFDFETVSENMMIEVNNAINLFR